MNKKIIIVLVFLIIVGSIAAGIAIYNSRYNPDYLYNKDGTIISADENKQRFFNSISQINDASVRNNSLNQAVSVNLITQEEANALYIK